MKFVAGVIFAHVTLQLVAGCVIVHVLLSGLTLDAPFLLNVTVTVFVHCPLFVDHSGLVNPLGHAVQLAVVVVLLDIPFKFAGLHVGA